MARVYRDKRSYLENRLRFQNLSKDANQILKEFNLSLNFKGFVETMVQYVSIDEHTSIVDIEILARDLICWVNYLGEVQTIIHYYKNIFEIKADCSTEELKKTEYKNKFFILKQYEKALLKEITRFSNACKDLIYQHEKKSKEQYKYIGE